MTRPNTTAAVGTVAMSGDDGYGNKVATPTWTFLPAIWWPGGSREVVGGQDQVTWHNTVCLPTGTVVQSTDVIIPVVATNAAGEVQYAEDGTTPLGDQFEVDGEPTSWPANSAGWQHPFSTVVNLTQKVP